MQRPILLSYDLTFDISLFCSVYLFCYIFFLYISPLCLTVQAGQFVIIFSQLTSCSRSVGESNRYSIFLVRSESVVSVILNSRVSRRKRNKCG